MGRGTIRMFVSWVKNLPKRGKWLRKIKYLFLVPKQKFLLSLPKTDRLENNSTKIDWFYGTYRTHTINRTPLLWRHCQTSIDIVAQKGQKYYFLCQRHCSRFYLIMTFPYTSLHVLYNILTKNIIFTQNPIINFSFLSFHYLFSKPKYFGIDTRVSNDKIGSKVQKFLMYIHCVMGKINKHLYLSL